MLHGGVAATVAGVALHCATKPLLRTPLFVRSGSGEGPVGAGHGIPSTTEGICDERETLERRQKRTIKKAR